MKHLQELYWEVTAPQIAELEASRDALDEDAVEVIRRIAHSLRGSGGTYGYPQVTLAAEALMDAPKEKLAEELTRLLTLLQELKPGPDPAPKRILVIDDDPAITELLRLGLEAPGREVLVANSATEAIEILMSAECALILLDLVLPDMDGRYLLSRMRGAPATAKVPIIVLSGQNCAQAKAECFALGADEFVEKPFDPEALDAMVAAKLDGASPPAAGRSRDELTQLPDRVAFTEIFQRQLTSSLQRNAPLALALVDLDNFRWINAKHSRDAGDHVLQQFTEIMIKCLRKSDQIARWVDDKLVVLFPGTWIVDGIVALEKVRASLRSRPIRVENGDSITLTMSVGITAVTNSASAEAAVVQAEYFLRRAKKEGRDRICSPVSDEEITITTRVLLAEDDDLIASIVIHRLQHEGFEVLHYTNGADAYAAAQNESIDMAILDVKMPGMDGFELLSRLRKIPSLARLPIVMLTSMGSEKDIARGFQLGADDYILKPFSPAELLIRAHRLLRKNLQPGDPDRTTTIAETAPAAEGIPDLV